MKTFLTFPPTVAMAAAVEPLSREISRPQWRALALAAGQSLLPHPPKMCATVADAFFAAAEESPHNNRAPHVALLTDTDALFAEPRRDDALFSAVAAVYRCLPWRAPDIGRFSPEMTTRLMFLELIGPTGMVLTNQCRAGLFFQCPHTSYPPHAHAAEEVYHVISGTAKWRQDFSPPADKLPGGHIHHLPWRAHAVESRREPLLALWGWTGDLDFESYTMRDFAAAAVDKNKPPRTDLR